MRPIALLILATLAGCQGQPAVVVLTPSIDETADIGGAPMHYQVYGSDSQGQPLLLLHGGGNNIGGSFTHQIRDFAARHRLIAPEQQGQGRTPDRDGPLDYVAMAEQTLALLDHLHVQRTDIIGWSDGGIIGLILASRHPERVRRLVVSGANTVPGAAAMTPESLAGDAAYDPGGDDDGRAAYARTSADPPEHFAVFERKLHALWDTQPAEGVLGAGQLARITATTLVMAGDHDVITLEHTLQIYHAIPHAQLLIVPDTGHDTLIARHDWLDPLIGGFLEQGTR